jgi:eukaryotic-like serine/threonine-protein kinase
VLAILGFIGAGPTLGFEVWLGLGGWAHCFFSLPVVQELMSPKPKADSRQITTAGVPPPPPAGGAAAAAAAAALTGEAICQELLAMGMSGEKYILEDKVAQGGMGAIYRAFDQGLKRRNAIKVVLSEVMQRPELLARFVEEARITGQLEHPNIIPVHDIGVMAENKLYFSMKFIQGEELGMILKRLRSKDERYLKKYSLYSLLTIFRKVCDAVAFAHSKGIIHRDIKPDNIMIGDYGEVLLVDWGLAKRADEPEASASKAGERTAMLNLLKTDLSLSATLKTRDGVIKGTPAYMAPEQAKGSNDRINHLTDVFLLGATLYTVATLQAPFTGDDIYEMVINAENGNFQHPALRAPDRQIPDELCRIILKAMAFEPDERYQSVAELSHDLDALLEGRAHSERKRFAPGEYLMIEGETGEHAYVIVSGQVEVYKQLGDSQVTLVRLGEGDVVGEMAMISRAPRSASVKALTPTEVIIINDDVMRQALGKLPPWMTKVVQALVTRLRAANTHVHPLMAGDCTYHVINLLRLVYPSWARPWRASPEEPMYLCLVTPAVIQEIASSLCIPRERVAQVIGRLLETPLVEHHGEERFSITNFELFCYFADLARVRANVDSTLQDDRTSGFFASAHELAISFSLGEADAEALEEIAMPSPIEVMGCDTVEEIPGMLEPILTQLREAPLIPPLGRE